jgi:membrane-bound lytic murein transglycosylase MltF
VTTLLQNPKSDFQMIKRIGNFRVIFGLLLLLLILLLRTAVSNGSDFYAEDQSISIQRVNEVWQGDLQTTIKQRRTIRVLVSYSNTNFFIDRGRPRGIEYELLNKYEKFLNQNPKSKAIKIKLVYRVLPFDQLIPALLEGRGDIIAAGLTITPERLEKVAFTRPYIKNINEIAVASKKVQGLKTERGLSDRKIYVVAGSSYVGHLKRLNEMLSMEGFGPAQIIEADKNLEAEDILQMINSGIYDLTVVDEHIAEIWSKALKDLVVRKDIVINHGGDIAWAVRKDNPQLLGSLNKFLQTHRQGTLIGNILLRRYFEDTRWVINPLIESERVKLEKLRFLFQKYAEMYNFDWLKIAALAYQESRLNQNARSPKGAVGIMQILPSTAAGSIVGIADIDKVENNIHAGVKYLGYLRDRYFSDPQIKLEAQIDFTFAAYNAGPARINSLRKSAKKMGLDPNRWFFNVEHVARRVIGQETVQYVVNIQMYYIAYKTSMYIVEKREKQMK